MQIKTITIIGAGNVAFHLGKRFLEKGIKVEAIFSRNKLHAASLAALLGAESTNDYEEIPRVSDMYIIAVSDDAIAKVAAKLDRYLSSEALVYHTSGSVSSEAVRSFFPRGGVFYPLQTFSKSRPANFDKLPICLHTEAADIKNSLEALAQCICPNVYWVNDEQRSSLHVAAVFVNNFTNHLYHIGHQICEKEQVSFDLLRPLIEETALKIQQNPPIAMQTGPARRGDEKTIQRHLDYLEDDSTWTTLYRLLSQSIIASHED